MVGNRNNIFTLTPDVDISISHHRMFLKSLGPYWNTVPIVFTRLDI